MEQKYANDFYEIVDTLKTNHDILQSIIKLIESENISGKVLEGGDRTKIFRTILLDLANGVISLNDSYQISEQKLPRQSSPHSESNKVFAKGWGERLVRAQFSRFYNQAVLEELKAKGEKNCFIPHSNNEDNSSNCTQLLAGKQSDVDVLYNRIIKTYSKDDWLNKEVMIPDHPHCTHVVKPIS